MTNILGTIRTESISIQDDAILPIELRDILARSPSPSRRSHKVDTAIIANPMSTLLSGRKSAVLISQLTLVEFLSSFSNGLLTVCIPRMAIDLHLPQHLIYWPSVVFGLTSGSCFIVAGAVTDVIGSRPVNLIGNLLLGCFNLACGLSQTGQHLIAFRALGGFALALYLPSSVAILTKAIANGRTRNIGFACSGMAQTLGFALGLVLGGIFAQTIGWRVGYYICGSGQLALFVSGYWLLPREITQGPTGIAWIKLRSDVDWAGAGMASCSLAMFAYVLASITTSISNIQQPVNIVLLTFSILLVPAFVFWVARQERLHRPALIPNSIWKNTAFTSTCMMILLVYAMVQTMELFCSLFYQQVQLLSPLQASLRFLPSVLFGALLNFITGLVVHRFSVVYLILTTTFFSAAAPLLMALIKPEWPYWYDAFPAQLLIPLSVDVLFTVGILIVSDVFPSRTQALAGAIFNTVAQFGNSIGLAIVAVISTAVTQHSSYQDKRSAPALLEGYRAGFWAAFAWMIVACAVGGYGLQKVGKVGLKKD